MPEETIGGGAGDRRGDGIGGMAALLPALPSLLLSLGNAYLRLMRTAGTGARVFRTTLVEQGIDPHVADDLTEIYLSVTDIRPFLGRLHGGLR